MGDFLAGKVLLFFALIGGVTGLWFYEGSKFIQGSDLDLRHRSFMPVTCSITGNVSAEERQSALAYFWQGNVRLDLEVRTREGTVRAHELVKPNGTDYAWRDDSGYGELSSVETYRLLSGVGDTSRWFCYPWLLVDFTKFDIPGNVTFQ